MIECEDLSKQFDDFWAVDGVSLNVQPGEVLALLGQNGAGKTTTVRMLTSVLAPTRGWARVAGFDVVRDPVQVRSSVGVLTEQHGLYGRMSAVEYLDYFGQIYGLDAHTRKKRSADLLEYFGLTYAANRRSGEYSKGMRQKLALARALLHEPPVLLLDEPTSAMDPESARLVRDHIASLRSSQRAIIICTHNLTEAESLADKIAIIYRGKIIEQGTPEQLKDRLLGPSEYELRTAVEWSPEGMALPDGVSVAGKSEQGWRFRVSEALRDNPRLLERLNAQRVPVVSLQEVPRTLEQVYLKAMSRINGGAQ
ncbi:MAG: ABC transporter ATP-binding protein [Anaerolineales bacterium]